MEYVEQSRDAASKAALFEMKNRILLHLEGKTKMVRTCPCFLVGANRKPR